MLMLSDAPSVPVVADYFARQRVRGREREGQRGRESYGSDTSGHS